MSLISFYGEECPHCALMKPIIEAFEKETGMTVERREVWHTDANMHEMEEYDKGVCGGVPYFYNTDTGMSICGEATVEELKDWAGK